MRFFLRCCRNFLTDCSISAVAMSLFPVSALQRVLRIIIVRHITLFAHQFYILNPFVYQK